MNFRFYINILFSKWALMFEWFWWGKRIAFVYRVGNGYLANYKTIWGKNENKTNTSIQI